MAINGNIIDVSSLLIVDNQRGLRRVFLTRLIFVLVINFTILGTFVDWYHGRYGMKPRWNFVQFLILFSIIKNGQKMFDLKLSPESIPCIHGIKVVSMLFLFCGHGIMTLAYSMTGN